MNAPIPIFRGQNFEFWKYKLSAFFRSEGLEQTLEQPLPFDKSWIRDDARARMIILESVDDKHVELIMSEKSAKDMVDKLEGLYSVLSVSDYPKNSKQKLRDDFLALKLSESDDPSQFFRRFESCVDKLDECGDHVSPKEILDCFQMAVAKSYRHLFDKVNQRLEPLEIVELVKKKILAEYAEPRNGHKAVVNGSKIEVPREKGNSWNTFKETFRDEPKECHRCGQSGHWARQCPQPKECYKCGREGHLKSQCTQQQELCYGCGQEGHQKFQCTQQQELCFGCGQAGHRKFECPERWQPPQNHAASTFKHRPTSTASVHTSPLHTSPLHTSPPSRRQSYEPKGAESPTQHLPSLMDKPISLPVAVDSEERNPDAIWILDSCATYHTVCDESLFSKCLPLEEPINVEVANGNTLTASKMGEVKVCFRVGNRSTVRVLPHVYLIEEFEQNLLSIQRLVHFGGSVVLKSSEVELRDASNQIIAHGKKQENLYVIKSYLEKSETDDDFDA